MIINHESGPWFHRWARHKAENHEAQYNGAYYYSQELCDNVIPYIRTNRNWFTVTANGQMLDHSIVFIHQNSNPKKYKWLRGYKDLILVCSLPQTVEAVKDYGHAIYIPLSVDIKYVEQFKVEEKTKEIAYAGRIHRVKEYNTINFPKGIDIISNLPREKFLQEMAKYKKVYASERAAIEAKILGCEVIPYVIDLLDYDFKVMDNSEIIPLLQREIDEVDGR